MRAVAEFHTMVLRALLALPDTASAFIRRVADKIKKHPVCVVASTDAMNRLPEVVEKCKPDLVFIDPELDKGLVLRSWKSTYGKSTALVCVTNEPFYAVEAFEAGAVHYLMMPADEEQIASAVSRASAITVKHVNAKILALPSQEGIDIRSVDDVIRVNGEGNYTRVVLEPSETLLLSKCLGDLEPNFTDAGLLRVHRSHMVNVRHVRQLKRGKSPILRLSNGDEVDVSGKYKDSVLDALHINALRR